MKCHNKHKIQWNTQEAQISPRISGKGLWRQCYSVCLRRGLNVQWGRGSGKDSGTAYATSRQL